MMKFNVKIFAALVLVLMLNVCAYAESLPSVTMLSTKTCPACEQMARVLKDIDAQYSGKISTSHIYLEDNPDIAEHYKVRYVPTLLFRDVSGRLVAQEVGYRSLEGVLAVFRRAGIDI